MEDLKDWQLLIIFLFLVGLILLSIGVGNLGYGNTGWATLLFVGVACLWLFAIFALFEPSVVGGPRRW